MYMDRISEDNFMDVFDYLYGREINNFRLTNKSNNKLVHSTDILIYIIKKIYDENKKLGIFIENMHKYMITLPISNRKIYNKELKKINNSTFSIGYIR